MQDTRVYPRLSVRLDAEARVGGGSSWEAALLLNLSAGGALLFTDREVPTLTVLSPLRFSLGRSEAELETRIEVEALVVRTLRGEAGESEDGFLSGLQFLNLHGRPFEQVRHFVYEGLQNQVPG